MAEMAVAVKQQMGIRIQTLAELNQFADLVVQAGWAPKGTTRTQAIVAMQFGMELGLSPLQALQNISVVNGRPAIWGDAMPALIYASGKMVDYQEQVESSGDAYAVHVTVQRRGHKPIRRSYSMKDAKRANLWGKPGSWTTNPGRMILIRARTFAFRDAFPDVLKGMTSVEEALDMPMELQQAEVIEAKAQELPGLETLFCAEPINQGGAPQTNAEPSAEGDIGPGDKAPRPRRPYTRKPKVAAEAAPVPPNSTQTLSPANNPPFTTQEPPTPPSNNLSRRDELLAEIRDTYYELHENNIPVKLDPDLEDMSIDRLVEYRAFLASKAMKQ